MSNVTIRTRPILVGYFSGNPIGFNGFKYRVRICGVILQSSTLSGLKRFAKAYLNWEV